MSSAIRWSRTESARQDPVKSHGVHFTPPDLARFLARRSLAHLAPASHYTVLDPACGDGELLSAILDEVDPEQHKQFTLIGVDRSPESVAATESRLSTATSAEVQVHQADFLSFRRTNGMGQAQLFDVTRPRLPSHEPIDLIISNPPYVRTQVLGSETAQQLAADYGLSGRVDLYHAFARGMTDHLTEGGILGLLCSNRFLTTLGGAALRELLWTQYELLEIFDLGDTKLFAAAVLPAIIIARKRTGTAEQQCSYVRSYEVRGGSDNGVPTTSYPSIMAAIDDGVEGTVAVNLSYEIERGVLESLGKPKDPWTMTSGRIADWLSTVERNTASTFGERATIRVGIKTTADSVFIRKDWESLPKDQQPEDELVHPLLTHHVAERWACRQADTRRVLYPHAVINGRRIAVPLEDYPRAKAYLESNHDRLAARTYVTKGGRKWYEVWVPQNPDDWKKPKIVFPDISELPRFFLDMTGAIVNGDCYWIAIDESLGMDDAAVMLAVANSSFAVKFYDAVCSNRLYAGRRRFITQYVTRFPLPKLSAVEKTQIRLLVEQLVADDTPSQERDSIERDLDDRIWQAFGLGKEVGR